MKRLTRTDIENMVCETINHLINEGYIPGMTFITYGKGNKFDRSKFIPDEHRLCVNKPHGLWASPLNDNGGSDWTEFIVHDWPEKCYTLDNHFIFRLSPNANVCVIDSEEKLKELPWTRYKYDTVIVDWDAVAKQYDAVFVDKKLTYYSMRDDIPRFFYWDAESLCVFNPDIIEPINETPEDFEHNSVNWKEYLENERKEYEDFIKNGKL